MQGIAILTKTKMDKIMMSMTERIVTTRIQPFTKVLKTLGTMELIRIATVYQTMIKI